MPTPLRPPPGRREEAENPTYRHWTLQEFWAFRDEVVSYANNRIIEADELDLGTSYDQHRAEHIRQSVAPLLALIGAYQEKTRLT